HVKRVGLFSAVIAEAAGWPAAEAERIRMAAPMHDVGKIGIPDAILQKPGKLTHDEFEIMKSHAVIGAELLEGSESPMLETAQDIALHHHERWDGRGYPHGLAAMEITESSRIVAIVDVYDALTHDRVYRPALPEEKALAMMRADRGRHFDPHLLDLFFEVLPEIRAIAGLYPDEESEGDTGESALQLLSNADNTAPMMHSS
ncbi:MAG: HD domain-containing protein, partial [Pirellulaceae bacterium]|nr:HD domain-containing protein [Pirellulaceae bacterium]